MEKTSRPQEGKSPVSSLKSIDKIIKGGGKSMAKVDEDSTNKEENSVHDPNLFTGVTAPFEPNLFTGVTAPVPQASLDNEPHRKDSNNSGVQELNEPQSLESKHGAVSKKVYGDVACLKDAEILTDIEGKKQKSALNNVGVEKQTQTDAKKHLNLNELVSSSDQRSDIKREKGQDAAIAEESEYKVRQTQNINVEGTDRDQKEVSVIKESADMNKNEATVDKECHGSIGEGKIDDVEAIKLDQNNTLISETNIEVENKDKLSLEEGARLVVPGESSDTKDTQIDISKEMGTGRQMKTESNDKTNSEDNETTVIHHQTVSTENNNIESNVKSVTEISTDVKMKNAEFVREGKGMLEGEQNVAVETISMESNGRIKSENRHVAKVEESEGIAERDQNLNVEARTVCKNEALLIKENDTMALGIENESDAMAQQEENKSLEAMKADPTISSAIVTSTNSKKEDASFFEGGKKVTLQAINPISNVDPNGCPVNAGTTHKMATVKNSENIDNIDAETMKLESKVTPRTKENIYVEGDVKKSIENILSEDYDEKYPVESDMLPASVVPVDKPTPNDILFGRGGLTNHHPGNRRFRDIVVLHKDDYMKAIKIVKPRVARKIVKAIRTGNPPGRFLKKNSKDNKWYDVGDRNAAEKASQALREKSQNEKKETKAKAKARYKKNEDSLKTLGNLMSYGNMPVSAGATMYGKGGAMMPHFPYVTPAMYGIIPPPGVQMPLLPAIPPFAGAGMSSDNSQFAHVRNDSLTSPMKNVFPHSSESTDKTTLKTTITGKIKDENDNSSPTKFKIPASNGNSVNGTNVESGQTNDDKPLAYPKTGGIFGATDLDGNIIVTDQDILCGRGGATNHHKGNKRFRDIVAVHRPDYVRAPKVQKPGVARLIVKAIRSGTPPGRFLKKGIDGKWFDIGDKRAAEKASQALREKPPDERKSLTQVNGDYFATFLAQQSAYGMHTGPLQGHTYVYPAYPATIVPQQHMNPALQGMQPLFMNLPPSTGTAVPNPSNGETASKKVAHCAEERNTTEESKNIEASNSGIAQPDIASAGNSCIPSSAKRRKIELDPSTQVETVNSGTEVATACSEIDKRLETQV